MSDEALRRAAELVVQHWRKHGAAHPEWPPDLVYALASEVLILLDRVQAPGTNPKG